MSEGVRRCQKVVKCVRRLKKVGDVRRCQEEVEGDRRWKKE